MPLRRGQDTPSGADERDAHRQAIMLQPERVVGFPTVAMLRVTDVPGHVRSMVANVASEDGTGREQETSDEDTASSATDNEGSAEYLSMPDPTDGADGTNNGTSDDDGESELQRLWTTARNNDATLRDIMQSIMKNDRRFPQATSTCINE